MAQENAVAKKSESPIERLKKVMSMESVQSQFKNALADNAPLFIASMIDVFGSDQYLQQCEPRLVIMEALKAATLKLPINKSLGFAYLIAYKTDGVFIPNFQIGYRGYIQLAQRTGQYRFINADAVYEGERVEVDRLSGNVQFYGEPTSDKAVGYFAYMETVTGFKKVIFWTKEKVEAHAKRFSKSYNSSKSPWRTDFDAMAIKTMLRGLLSKYGVMSVELANAIETDNSDMRAYNEAQAEVEENANQGQVIDITEHKTEETKDKTQAKGPGF